MATLLFHPDSFAHETGDHVESPGRIEAVLRELDATGLRKVVPERAPEPASFEQLERVHSSSLVASLRALAAAGGGVVDADTRMGSPASLTAALRAAGGAIDAARLALDGEPAFSLARPPGHHATRDRAMGFCFFNNAAVAAQWAIDTGRARRVAIFDPDVHHGNGTQDVFWTRSDVLYVSVHEVPLYPGTGWPDEVGAGEGEGFTVNLPVRAGTGEGTFLRILEEIVVPVLREHAPDLLLVSAGYDAHYRDPLGHLRLGSSFYGETFDRLRRAFPRIAAVLEGGYDPVGLGRGVAASLGALAGRRVAYEEAVPPDVADPRVVEAHRRAHRGRWSSL